jgi:hypothetical protein
MNDLMNLGVGGAVIVLVIKEMFVFLKGDKRSEGLIAISRTLDNSIMMLELLQERAKDHEGNAKLRHTDMLKTISDHGLSCSKQAERIERILDK